MPYLSQTFESYQRVKIYTYSVNGLWFEEIFTVIWNLRVFYSLQIEHYALKIAFCVQCYSALCFPTAYYSVNGVNSLTTLNRMIIWFKSSRFSHLFGKTVTNRTDYAIQIYAREVICFYSQFFCPWGQFV